MGGKEKFIAFSKKWLPLITAVAIMTYFYTQGFKIFLEATLFIVASVFVADLGSILLWKLCNRVSKLREEDLLFKPNLPDITTAALDESVFGSLPATVPGVDRRTSGPDTVILG